MLIKGTRGVGLGLLPKAKYGRIVIRHLYNNSDVWCNDGTIYMLIVLMQVFKQLHL
jgi:hypothetical protein